MKELLALALFLCASSAVAANIYVAQSAPGTPPTYLAVAAWVPIDWLTPTGNASFDNVNQTCAYQGAVIGQVYLSSNTTITGHCNPAGVYPQTYVPSNVESTLQTNIAALSPAGDPAQIILSTSASVLNNAHMLYQFGTPSNSCATGDCLVMPYWNTLGITTLTTGGAAGGNLYTLSANYTSAGVHPYMQILYPAVIHEGDLQLNPSPSQMDAFNYMMNVARPIITGGLGGNL